MNFNKFQIIIISFVLTTAVLFSIPFGVSASLSFTGSTDNVAITANSSIDSLPKRTVAAWVLFTSLQSGTENPVIWYKKTNSNQTARFVTELISSVVQLRVTIFQSTSTASYKSNNASLSANTWYFVAYTYDDSATPRIHIYKGGLSSIATELTYGTASDGSGTVNADSNNPLRIGGGNGDTNTNVLNGRIAWLGEWNRVLTLGEIRQQQFRPHVTSGNVLFTHLGFNGIGTQPDWSGKGNRGTVTGATVAPHVPLRGYFGMRRY